MKNSETLKLPSFLKHYRNKGFLLQLKARFLYYLCLTGVLSILSIILIAFYIHSQSPAGSEFNVPAITIEIALLFIFIGCIFLVYKGWFNVASNIIIITTLLGIWFIIGFDGGETITRLNNIIYLFAILSMLPLAISTNRYLIPIYILVNIVCLFLFVSFFDFEFNLTHLSTIDFLADGTIAFVFMGIVVYNNYMINTLSHNKSESDMQQRVLAEEALIKSEKKYREMMELLPQVVFEAELNGKLTYINRNGYELFGYTLDEFEKGINIFSTLHPDDHAKASENIKKTLHGEKSHGNEYRGLRKNGSIFPIQIYSALIVENNQPVGLRGIIIDITEKNLAEKELIEREKKYRTLMENMNETVMLVDHEDRVLFVNRKFTEKLGYTPEEIIGKIGYLTLLEPKNHQMIKDANLDRIKNKTGQYEMTFIGKDGQRVDFLVSGAPIFDSEGNAVGSIGNMTDITEKKIIEKELEVYREKLEELVKLRTEELQATNEELMATNDELFHQKEELKMTIAELHSAQDKLIESEKMASLGILSAGIAHEINNPLNFIMGGIYRIESYVNDNLQNHQNQIEQMLQDINTGVERVSKIVISLNHFSRQSESLSENCDVHQIIDNCLIMLQNQLKFKIEIVKKLIDAPLIVVGNEGKLHQAFLNILSNSEQAVPEMGIISIETAIENGFAIITISDNGIGIKEEHLSKIFNPFFTTKDPGKGTGLGLSITYKIIRDHCGTLEYKSKLGLGTTAIVKLLIKQTEL